MNSKNYELLNEVEYRGIIYCLYKTHDQRYCFHVVSDKDMDNTYRDYANAYMAARTKTERLMQ